MEVEIGEVMEEDLISKVTIEDLPDEVLEYIISLVSPYKELKECMLVCKRWHFNVKNVVRLRNHNLAKALTTMHVAWQAITPADMAPTITKRYSHSACCHENSMYVFGGCTSTLTTFNDLWRFDLHKRQWIRPLTVGTYPSPKACATMVQYKDALFLFGGWTHPSPYPIHQAWRLFNELHMYNIITNRWICIHSAKTLPPMAGHSASVHGDTMVVFGGLTASLRGQYSSSNDVWCFSFEKEEWHQQQTSAVKPGVRYGQSQIPLGENYVLIIGGCGGPNTMFSDVWLLTMIGDIWQWQEIKVRNPDHSASHMWCHPACKVGDQVVMMGRHQKATKTFMPCTGLSTNQRINGLSHASHAPYDRSTNTTSHRHTFLRDANVNGQRGSLSRSSQASVGQQGHESKAGRIAQYLPCDSLNRPSTSGMRSGVSTTFSQNNGDSSEFRIAPTSSFNPGNSNTHSVPAPHVSIKDRTSSDIQIGTGGSIPGLEMAAFRELNRHVSFGPARVREKQLEVLKKFEDRIRNIVPNRSREVVCSEVTRPHISMAVYVMDITNVLNEGYVEWLESRPEESSIGSPEETIFYSLVVGRGELIMFGGIQKDALSVTSQIQANNSSSVSNSVHFISAHRDVI